MDVGGGAWAAELDADGRCVITVLFGFVGLRLTSWPFSISISLITGVLICGRAGWASPRRSLSRKPIAQEQQERLKVRLNNECASKSNLSNYYTHQFRHNNRGDKHTRACVDAISSWSNTYNGHTFCLLMNMHNRKNYLAPPNRVVVAPWRRLVQLWGMHH